MANRELPEPKVVWCLGAILALSFSMTGCTGGNSYGPPPPPVLSISSASLSDATMGAAYAQTIQATGGMPPFNWSVSSGALPLGLMLVPSSSNSVMISGTPSAAQTGVAFTIQVTDASGQSAKQSYTVNIKPVLSISTLSLSDGTLGAPYTQTIQATGGVAPFRWSVFSLGIRVGILPAGLTLVASSTNSVTISGTPSAVQTNVAFRIRIADASGQSATQGYVVTIKSTVAQTQSGAVQGALVPCPMPECTASNVLEFLGIPYASPPIGNLRWAPPQPATPWTGTTRDATVPGSICEQPNGRPPMSEDCLFVNVFISSQTPHGQQQPVMVFIHGGANRQGNARPGRNFSDPPELATQGVILVTLQYRLGLLGFFTHPSLDIEGGGSSGNYGLRDQIAALAWVQQNIASFGGDPTHVMVFGLSSGSSDVESLLASPLTQGPSSQCGPSQRCFSAAGMEAGAVVHGQYLTLAAKEAQDAPLVAGLGCDTAADPLACLRALPAATLVAPCVPPATTGCNPNAAYQSWYSGNPVLIVNIEPQVAGAAVPVNPYDWLQLPQQGGSPVPLLLGSNREDAAMSGVPSWCTSLAPPACPDDDPTTSLIDEPGFATAIHDEFDPLVTGSGNAILNLYPTSNILDLPVWQLIAVDSDLTVGATCSYREVARAAVGTHGASVWRYIYTHAYENNDPNLTPFRAFHGAELPFVFGDPSFAGGAPGSHTPTQAELTLSGQMMGYWTRFATTSNPNGSGATVWPRYDATDAMLQVDDTSTEINGYRTPQCDFYDANAAALANVQ